MGHLVNPNGFRLGGVREWSSKMESTWMTVFLFKKLSLFFSEHRFHNAGMLFSHVTVRPIGNTFFIQVFFNEGLLLELSGIRVKRRRVKFGPASRRVREEQGVARGKVLSVISEGATWSAVKLHKSRGAALVAQESSRLQAYLRQLPGRFFNESRANVEIGFLYGINTLADRLLTLGVQRFIEFWIRDAGLGGVNFRIIVSNLGPSFAGPAMLGNYIRHRLFQRTGLAPLLRKILGGFFRRMRCKGLMFICAGRFSKKDRATFSMMKRGNIGLSSSKQHLTYALEEVVLKYGICGVKVYISY